MGKRGEKPPWWKTAAKLWLLSNSRDGEKEMQRYPHVRGVCDWIQENRNDIIPRVFLDDYSKQKSDLLNKNKPKTKTKQEK